VPVVEYSSGGSGVAGGEGQEGCGGVGEVVGPRERSRMDWVMVGWLGPPKGEWARRCVGRVWPRLKKVEMGELGLRC
jgi:hypothetical protein